MRSDREDRPDSDGGQLLDGGQDLLLGTLEVGALEVDADHERVESADPYSATPAESGPRRNNWSHMSVMI
jgi:hypothetical protein